MSLPDANAYAFSLASTLMVSIVIFRAGDGTMAVMPFAEYDGDEDAIAIANDSPYGLSGQVWGTDIYTRDSIVGAAAVHMGLLKPGQTAVLRRVVEAARPSYPGSARNGVVSSDYGDYPQCWRLSAI